MNRTVKGFISAILTLSILLCSVLPIFAAGEEEYLCELRLIYAEDYAEAKEILADSEFRDYKLLKENLNEDTEEIGVWLAYKTTTNINDAITDISVMEMDGGYQEGNYQEMIQKSLADYAERGEVYLKAIQYFTEAYDEGSFMAEIAYRQLNFYVIESEGIPESEIPDFEGELLGDIFLDGVTAEELATMFLEGNTYALRNIRALLCMGVAYNEDDLSYLEKVGEEVEALTDDPDLYANEEYRDLAVMISPTILVFKDMFKELEAYEDELNYEDEDFTDLEMQYLEYKAMAEMTRDVDYLDGKTLYEFCKEYRANEEDYSALYPLVAALNEGQVAMTMVAHYYDVVRYSVPSSGYSEEDILDELELLEEEYEDEPFNLYTGVDRTIYRGSFALTSAADRANAFTESGLMDTLFEGQNRAYNLTYAVTGTIGAGFLLGAATAHLIVKIPAWKAMYAYKQNLEWSANYWGMNLNTKLAGESAMAGFNPDIAADYILAEKYVTGVSESPVYADWSFTEKLRVLEKMNANGELSAEYSDIISDIRGQLSEFQNTHPRMVSAQEKATQASQAAADSMGVIGALYAIGGVMMLVSAIKLGISVYNYYYPEFDDIPVAMVDLIETVDGDRYIKYDVVFETEEQEEGVYAAADLNAFAGHRWNALYYTKSYEAGKPLLADSFYVSNESNTPRDGYAPVHRFGETVCHNLNKYTFEDDTSIYLSVKQSKNDKSAVADVPELVGSMFSTGLLAVAGGVGLIAGVGGTLAAMGITKKKKIKG